MSSELRFTGGATSAALTIRTSANAKSLRLRVDPRTGAVLLTVPRRMSHKRAVDWAMGQRGWIESALADIAPPARFAPGAVIPFRGEPHLIDWAPERGRAIVHAPGRLIAGGPVEGLAGRVGRWLRAEALALLHAETLEVAAKAGVTVTKVGIGDTVSRWASCSSTGTIRYSWRLILAPDWVRRATVAHEVAHRIHMNHGPQFHRLVETLFGADPGPARRWLRSEGAALHRIGREA